MMKLVKTLVFFFSLLGLQALAQPTGFIYHTVEKGETRYGISRQYGITVPQLDSLNSRLSETGLRPGLELLVPRDGLPKKPSATPTPAQSEKRDSSESDSSDYLYHKVQAGETIYSLLREYDTDRSSFDKANPEFEGLTLRVGSVVRFPKKPEEVVVREEFITHVVKPRETAYSLAQTYQVSLDSLIALNPEVKNGLRIGQKLRLPNYKQLDSSRAERIINQKESLNSGGEPQMKEGDTLLQTKNSDEYLLYKVKAGDTFYSLGKRYNTTHEELVEINPELSAGLKVGKYIIIPKKKMPEELGWLNRLFNKVEKPQGPENPVSEKTEERKMNLNEGSKKKLDSVVPPLLIVDTPQVNINKEYRIAVVLPFMAQSLPRGDEDNYNWQPNSNSEMSVHFYHGFLLAADSMLRKGMSMRINVYDSRGSLKEMRKILPEIAGWHPDLVVGPAYRQNVEFLADALRDKKIPVLSPLSRSVEVEGRSNLIQMVPSENSKNSRIAHLINQYHDSAQVIFAHCGSENELKSVQEITARLNPRKRDFIQKMVNCESFSSRNVFRDQLSYNGTKVVVFLSEDPVFLSDLTTKLSALNDTNIYLVGSPRLLDLPTVEIDYLEKLHFTTYEVRNTDFSQPDTREFVQEFRARFVSDPSPFALQGYDAGHFFLPILWENGSFFLDKIIGAQGVSFSTGFEFEKTKDGGIQNNYLFITGVRDYRLVRLE